MSNVPRAMDMPLVLIPVNPIHLFWIVFEPLVFRIMDGLPFRLGSFSRYGRRGWHFHDKAASHVDLGDVFALVTPRETKEISQGGRISFDQSSCTVSEMCI